jgi:hypothetical protein
MSKVQVSRRTLLSTIAAAAAVGDIAGVEKALGATDLGASGLVGHLEGPTMITDPTKRPQAYQEAPMLAERVKAGKLPPVAERVPAEPMVWQPLNEIGKYGGTWRRAFTGPATWKMAIASTRRTSASSGARMARRSCPASPRRMS